MLDDPQHSGKLMVLLAILAKCNELDEKVVVFSDCLSSFYMIEHFLSIITQLNEDGKSDPRFNGLTGTWIFDEDYFRMDGDTDVQERKRNMDAFNNKTNKRAR